MRQRPGLDLVRVLDVGLRAVDDPTILAWAAREGRLVLTHDASTLIGYAYERVATGQVMPGIIVVRQDMAIGHVLEDLLLLLLIDASDEGEWNGQVIYLPLR